MMARWPKSLLPMCQTWLFSSTFAILSANSSKKTHRYAVLLENTTSLTVMEGEWVVRHETRIYLCSVTISWAVSTLLLHPTTESSSFQTPLLSAVSNTTHEQRKLQPTCGCPNTGRGRRENKLSKVYVSLDAVTQQARPITCIPGTRLLQSRRE